MSTSLFIEIRNKTRIVCEQAEFVRLHTEKIPELAAHISKETPAPWYASIIPLNELKFEDAARFLLLLDITNFCNWPEPLWRLILDGKVLGGTFSLAHIYKCAFQKDSSFLSPTVWADLDLARYQHITKLPSGTSIPLAKERALSLQKLGILLAQSYNNSVQIFLDQHQNDAEKIVRTLISQIPFLDDAPIYNGAPIPFYKRAQLIASDLSSLLKSFGQPPLLSASCLTACADYKLPQLLRQHGVVSYDNGLDLRVDQQLEILSGSKEEIEIRAATVHAIHKLKQHIDQTSGANLSEDQIGGKIWLLSQTAHQDIKPHHRTLTAYY